MELERPGVEKKKRWEAWMEAKSGVESESESEEVAEDESSEGMLRDLEVEAEGLS